MKSHIFIGYDEREKDPYSVCIQSLKDNSQNPDDIVIHPLNHRELRAKGLFDRPWMIESDGSYRDIRDARPFSVQFSHSRFLTPYLAKSMGIIGPAMFVDCDFVFQKDVHDLTKYCREEMYEHDYPVMVVKHDYSPENTLKMDGSPQAKYNRKLWSSLMVFDTRNKANEILSPEAVSQQPGSWLHQFQWLEDSARQIGPIPEAWNFIPGHSDNRLGISGYEANAIHYTEGGPWFSKYEDCLYGDIWTRYFYRMNRTGIPR